jgi:hypothetical protein
LEGKSREETDAKTQEEILSLIAQHVKVISLDPLVKSR